MRLSGKAKLPEVKVFSLNRHLDHRGYVTEVFNSKDFAKLINKDTSIHATHETFSRKGVLRGLHYQIGSPQSRLVRVSFGSIFNVAVDIRKSSPTFGKWQGEILSSDNLSAMWIPSGFAHGYFVLSNNAIVNVYTDCEWSESNQRCIRWDDDFLSIDWPIYSDYPVYAPPIVSDKDNLGKKFLEAEIFD